MDLYICNINIYIYNVTTYSGSSSVLARLAGGARWYRGWVVCMIGLAICFYRWCSTPEHVLWFEGPEHVFDSIFDFVAPLRVIQK